MALSRDCDTVEKRVDLGCGAVCDIDGGLKSDLIVTASTRSTVSIAQRLKSDSELRELPFGTLLRILPNHSCATGARFDQYDVIPASRGDLKK